MGYGAWVKSFAKGSLYTVYVVRTTSKLETDDSVYPFKPGPVETLRRFSEFASLHEQLSAEGQLSGYAVPCFPEKKYLNSGTDEVVVEQRRVALQSFLRELVKRPELRRVERLRLFLLTSLKLESVGHSAMLTLGQVTRLVKPVYLAVDADYLKAYFAAWKTEIADEELLVQHKCGKELDSQIAKLSGFLTPLQS